MAFNHVYPSIITESPVREEVETPPLAVIETDYDESFELWEEADTPLWHLYCHCGRGVKAFCGVSRVRDGPIIGGPLDGDPGILPWDSMPTEGTLCEKCVELLGGTCPWGCKCAPCRFKRSWWKPWKGIGRI